jgi:hypothetical protein
MKHYIPNEANGNNAGKISGSQASAIKKRAKAQLKTLNDSLPETRMASTLSHDRKLKNWKRFSRRYMGKKLFVQDN